MERVAVHVQDDNVNREPWRPIGLQRGTTIMAGTSINRRVATRICGTALPLLAAGCLEQGAVAGANVATDEVDQDGLSGEVDDLKGESTLQAGYHDVVLYNNHSRKCAAIGGASTSPGTRAIQWHCTGHEEQRWDLRQHGGTWEIVNRSSDLCLAVGGGSTTPGADVIQWHCQGTYEQLWVRAVHGAYDVFHNLNSGLCLSVAGGSAEDGTKLIQWYCDWIRPEQFWDCLTPDATRCHDTPPS